MSELDPSVVPTTESLANDAQVVQNLPPFPEQGGGFATNPVIQETPPAPKAELLDAPATLAQRLSAAVASLKSAGIQEVLALAVADEEVVIVNRGGRPTVLDPAARRQVCLLL